MGSRIVHVKPWNLYGAPQKEVLNYEVASFFGPPMRQYGSDSVEILVW